MNESDDGHWEVVGYGLWLLGSTLFLVAAARSRDWLTLAGSVLFFAGVVVVLVPMTRSLLRRR